MATRKTKQPVSTASGIDTLVKQVAHKMSGSRVVREGTSVLIRATGAGGGDFRVECSREGVHLAPADSMAGAPPTIEIMGDVGRFQAVLTGRKDARKEFLAGGFRVRGDLRYFSDLAVELGILKMPL